MTNQQSPVFEPQQVALIKQAYEKALTDPVLAQPVDELTAEALALAVLQVANERVGKGYSLRNNWDSDAIALTAVEDHLGRRSRLPALEV